MKSALRVTDITIAEIKYQRTDPANKFHFAILTTEKKCKICRCNEMHDDLRKRLVAHEQLSRTKRRSAMISLIEMCLFSLKLFRVHQSTTPIDRCRLLTYDIINSRAYLFYMYTETLILSMVLLHSPFSLEAINDKYSMSYLRFI